MSSHPYEGLPSSAFWKTGVASGDPSAIAGIYRRKFSIPADARVATAGSCFAQHIVRNLKRHGFTVLDVEPAPSGLPGNRHQAHGFSMYSARFGNIYTVRQLLQLVQEAAGEWTPANLVWEKGGKFFDALRPAVEPAGLDSPAEVIAHRRCHMARVREMLERLDVFIFTLGLTEMWTDRGTGTVYPTAPGTIAGTFDERVFEFKNATSGEVMEDFGTLLDSLAAIRGGRPFSLILTVSPVPLTATSSGDHVLVSTAYSKAVLRTVAGELARTHAIIDYFPAYEIVTNPRLCPAAFAPNLRTVTDEAVELVMRHFFQQHPPPHGAAVIGSVAAPRGGCDAACPAGPDEPTDPACDDMILETFAPAP